LIFGLSFDSRKKAGMGELSVEVSDKYAYFPFLN